MSHARRRATSRGNSLTLRHHLVQYARLARLHRPIGMLLLLWPMLWALWIAAAGVPRLEVLVVFVLGTIVMRSAGCVINDYADRNFDGHVERTRGRPLPSGTVTPRAALVLFGVLLAIAAALVLATNRLTIMLAAGGALLAITYPFAKRYTSLPQLHLGAAFGWAVPMAFTAQTGGLSPLAWLLFSTAVLWALIYDTQYAMVDREDDIRLGIRSSAILFADADRLIIGGLQCLMLSNLYLIGARAGLAWPYTASLVVAAGLFVYQQYLIRDRNRAGCFAAFMNNNWVGGVIFLGMWASYPPAVAWLR